MTAQHTPTPWMISPCGAMAPDDVMIVADFGRNENGIQQISTVAKALSIRQTKEVTAANAAFIVRACNAHEELVRMLQVVLMGPLSIDGGVNLGEARQRMRADILAAIAKAEGK